MEGGTLIAEAGEAPFSYGIEYSPTINGGTVVATGQTRAFNYEPDLSGYADPDVRVNTEADYPQYAKAWNGTDDLGGDGSSFQCVIIEPAGYDVWVYTTGYASTDHLRGLFFHHRIGVDGIINGANRLNSGKNNDMSRVKELMAKKYRITLNIDTDTVSWIRSETKEFEMIDVKPEDGNWAREVIEIVRRLKDL